MIEYPRIKIVSDGLTHGEHTKILTPDKEGNWVEITNAVSEIDLKMKAGQPNKAKIKAVLVGAEVDALVTEMETRVLPPPQPKVRYRLDVNGIFWVLTRLTPLPTYGVKEEIIATAVADETDEQDWVIVGDAE